MLLLFSTPKFAYMGGPSARHNKTCQVEDSYSTLIYLYFPLFSAGEAYVALDTLAPNLSNR